MPAGRKIPGAPASVAIPDRVVVFVDAADAEYELRIPSDGHRDNDVRAVAYRYLCRQIADGVVFPYREVKFARIRRL